MELVKIYEDKIKELMVAFDAAETKKEKTEIKDDIEFFMAQLTEARKQVKDEQDAECKKAHSEILKKEKVLAPLKAIPLPGLDVLHGISFKNRELKQRKELQEAEFAHKENMLETAYKASNEGWSLDKEIERQSR